MLRLVNLYDEVWVRVDRVEAVVGNDESTEVWVIGRDQPYFLHTDARDALDLILGRGKYAKW